MFDVVNADEAHQNAIDTYRKGVAHAYNEYADDVVQIKRENTPGSEAEGEALKGAAARRGALLAAASKRARRAFVAMLLDGIRCEHDLDLTMTTAAAIFRATTGFAPAKSFLVKRYSNPGRTARDKSRLTDQESHKIDAIAAAFKPHVGALLDEFPAIRRGHSALAQSRIKSTR